MSNDSVSVTTNQSWFSRIGNAIAGVLVGIILFVAAFPLLTWNEGRAIKREKTLQEGSKSVVSIAPSPIVTANEGKLVHITGDATPDNAPMDPVFGISAPAIKLHRNVEMYQWTESKKDETKQKLGGGEETVTTYSYSKDWSSSLVDSSSFQKQEGHENPAELPVQSKTFQTDRVTVGAFTLPESLIAKIDDYQPLPVTAHTEASTALGDSVKLANEGFYIGANPSQPAIGDVRVRFEVVNAGTVSIVARQVQDTFEPYQIAKLGEIELLQIGTFSAENMFATETQNNAMLTWLLRLAGFVAMFIGLVLIAKPLSVIGSVIPFVGDVLGAGFGMIAFVIALPLTLATISIAWIAFRPLIGIPVLILAGVCIFLGARYIPRKKKAA